jgi:hypothetical protein
MRSKMNATFILERCHVTCSLPELSTRSSKNKNKYHLTN